MSMKILVTTVLIVCFVLLLFITTWTQEPRTLYYTSQWEITTRDSSVYYRKCRIDTVFYKLANQVIYKFSGEVTDFSTSDDRLLMQGYYANGRKNGTFTFYYVSGQFESTGKFKNNLRDSIWSYFYPNGSLLRTVTFNTKIIFNSENTSTTETFFVNAQNDSAGNSIIKDGTGDWFYEYEWYQSSSNFRIWGTFLKRKKVGDWVCALANGQLMYLETYKRDHLKKSVNFMKVGKILRFEPEFPNKFLPSYKHIVTEDFLFKRGITRDHYPFLRFLPIGKTDNQTHNSMPISSMNNKIIEEPASPQGGMTVFHSFVSKNIKYPTEARRRGLEGNVIIGFTINNDGSLTDLKVVKGISAECDAEAIRIMSLSPHWNPGKHKGNIVKQRMIIPIIFKLD